MKPTPQALHTRRGVKKYVRLTGTQRAQEDYAFARTWSFTQPLSLMPPLAFAAATALPLTGTPAIAIARFRMPPPLRRHDSHKLSWFALVVVHSLIVINIPCWLVFVDEHPTPMGLRIRLLKPDAIFQTLPGLMPVALLRTELKRRPPDWPVYVDGDPDMEWQWPVHVIDTIRALHAEVVLRTIKPPPKIPPLR